MSNHAQKKHDSGTNESKWLKVLATASFILDALALVFHQISGFPWGHQLNLAAGLCTMAFVLWAIYHMVATSDKTFSDVEVMKEPVLGLERQLQQSAVRAIQPHNLDDFRLAFDGAQKIRAYNPPLTLLTDTDQQFREVIYDILAKNGTQYQAIVGEEGCVQLLSLWGRWITEHGERAAKKAGCNMLISLYKHKEQLHTPLDHWPCLGQDLRGLSFFLIDAQNCRRSLLYILGEPFTPDFDVPKIGLLITEPEERCNIYQMMGDTFDYRWQLLNRKGEAPLVMGERSLPEFYKIQQNGRAPLSAVPPQAQALAPGRGNA